MKNRLILLASVSFTLLCKIASVEASQPECLATSLKAQYKIVKANNSNVELNLIRNNREVAHQYPQTQITEAWQLNANNQIKPIRFFDQHERAIEYQPGEKIHGRTETDWNYRFQLMNSNMLSQFVNITSQGTGCEQIEYKTFSNEHVELSLVWMPLQQLVKEFRVTDKSSNQQVEHWQLQHVSYEKSQIEQFFSQRYHYNATDFADIGDDHTDPFLTQMLNLGFIEHASSGFYNQNGHAISGSHSH